MSSFDEKLGALLRAPVDQAQRQAEKVKACADVYAKSVEEQTLTHVAPAAVDLPAPAAIHVVREYPLLWHASVGRPLLVVAGTSPQAQERIRWLEERVARHAWQEVKDSQGHVLDSLARRIREGSHCGVVLFAATTGSITARTVRESCESSRTPLANANKPGVGTLGHALRTIEIALERAQESA